MHRGIKCTRLNKLKILIILAGLSLPLTLKASFIEVTMGTAVVNDATAVYFNPAALALLKKPQIIGLSSFAWSRSLFTGEAVQAITGFTLTGGSDTRSSYTLPSFYFATPIGEKFAFGIAVISNFLNKDVDGTSILRYAQSGHSIKDIDFVPAIEFKLNKYLSLGAAANISHASFLLTPTTGFPSLGIPDSQSRNQCEGDGFGGDVGCLLTISKCTLIGFNYRSKITYHLKGTSIFEGNTEVISNNYGFTFWAPGRYALSINQLLTSKSGVVATVHRIQWSVFKEINVHGIATQIGLQPTILNGSIPYHFRDTWLLTLGNYYQITPKWIIRLAGSYNQSPGNSNFQIVNGDSIILGATMAYQISKNITIDGGYAHSCILNTNIHATTALNRINGVTRGSLDVLSLKLTFNLK